MTEEESENDAAVCNHPRVKIDAWGQRLHGCIQCNQWMSADGQWLRLPEADIAALRGVSWRRSKLRDHFQAQKIELSSGTCSSLMAFGLGGEIESKEVKMP